MSYQEEGGSSITWTPAGPDVIEAGEWNDDAFWGDNGEWADAPIWSTVSTGDRTD